MKKILIMTLVFLVSSTQAMIIPATSLEKYNGSTNVLEGEVLSSKSEYDAGQKMIITNFKIKVLQSIYGDIEMEEIIVKVMGGELDERILIVTPNDEFQIGEIGVFFLNEKQGVYTSSFLAQSFVSQTIRWTKEQVQTVRNQPKQIQNVLETNRAVAASSIAITSISPQIISGGNGQILTITGSGFGATGPSSGVKVMFFQNDLTGTHRTYSNSNYYLSWSDTEIKVRVPEKAGTGTVLVGSLSSHATSSILTVKYSVRERELFLSGSLHPRTMFLPSDGMPTGIKFHLSNTFDYNNPDHTTGLFTIRAALHEWNCETQLDELTYVYPQTQNTHSGTDNLNVIFLDNTMGSNVLGLTYYSVAVCGGVPVVTDTDVGFNANINWNYTRNPSASNEYDLYHTALHEFGHMRNLGHAINPGNIMYPAASIGPQLGSIDAYNVEGGQWIQNDSRTKSVCSFDNMTDGICGLTEMHELHSDSDIKIFPNPCTLRLQIKGGDILGFRIFNTFGQLLIKQETSAESADVSNLETGVYMIELLTSIGVIKKSFIKK